MTKRALINSLALFCLAVITIALFSAGRISAGSEAAAFWRLGSWAGTGRMSSGNMFLVVLLPDPVKTNRATIRVSEPWACQLRIAAASQDGKAVVFGINSSGGGRCDRYLGGNAQVRKTQSADRLILTLEGLAASDKLEMYIQRRNDTPGTAPQPLKTGKTKKDKTN